MRSITKWSALLVAMVLAVSTFGAENNVVKSKPKKYVPPTVLSITFSNPRVDKGMIFYPGEPIKIKISIENMTKNEANGDLKISITDPYGNEKVLEDKKGTKIPGKEEINFEYNFSLEQLDNKLGVYVINVLFDCEPKPLSNQVHFAYIQKPRQLTEEVKMKSPWGLNDIASHDDVPLSMFADIGVVWQRDYGYNYNWFKGAREGTIEDPAYFSKWPWFDKMMRYSKSTGMKLLACHQGALKNFGPKEIDSPDGKGKKTVNTVPTAEWLDEFRAFYKVFGKDGDAWQLDNEAEPGEGNPEWNKAYNLFHREWAKTSKASKVHGYVVENGRAGIHSENVGKGIRSGDLAGLDATAGHFYTGKYAPETSSWNANTNFKGENDRQLLRDNLMNFVRETQSDGNTEREAWITEFGWDSKAGGKTRMVNLWEQAAYLQRGYLVGLYAGISKMFWFFYMDSPGNAVFFDGCGLYDWAKRPKPVVGAAAHLFNTLHDFKIVGTFSPKSDVMGYVFEQDGKQLACMFQLIPVDKHFLPTEQVEKPVVDLDGEWTDMFGNKIQNKGYKLGIDPIWTTDLKNAEAFLPATAYELSSKGAANAYGTTKVNFTLEARSRVGAAVKGDYELILPAGWVADKPTGTLDAPINGKTEQKIVVTLPEKPADGDYSIFAKVTDASGVVKFVPFWVKSRNPFITGPLPFAGAEGVKTPLNVMIWNESGASANLSYKLNTPKSWKASPSKIDKAVVPSNFVKADRITFDLTWSSEVDEKEEFSLDVIKDGKIVARQTIPMPYLVINKVGDIKLDGDFSDWPKSSVIDPVAIGRLGHAAGRFAADVILDIQPMEAYLGWNEKGIYYAFRVENSEKNGKKPQFGIARNECVEFFFDTNINKKPRQKYDNGDYHFYAIPMIEGGDGMDSNSVYLGRIPHREIAKPLTFKGTGFSRASQENGYVIEGFIPADAVPTLKLFAGSKFCMNFNLLNNRLDGNKEELYWPSPLKEDVRNKPDGWGTAFLK